MRSDHIFKSVLAAHGTSITKFAIDQGKAAIYYSKQVGQREFISAYAYSRYLQELGAEIWAVRGNERRNLTEFMMNTSSKGRLQDFVEAYRALDYELVVLDGTDEYLLDCAQIVEKHKEKRDGDTGD